MRTGGQVEPPPSKIRRCSGHTNPSRQPQAIRYGPMRSYIIFLDRMIGEFAGMPATGHPRSQREQTDSKPGLFARCSSVDADRGTQGLPNRPVEDEVGDRVESGRLAVYDRESRTVALREFREGGGRIDDQRGSGDNEHIGG